MVLGAQKSLKRDQVDSLQLIVLGDCSRKADYTLSRDFSEGVGRSRCHVKLDLANLEVRCAFDDTSPQLEERDEKLGKQLGVEHVVVCVFKVCNNCLFNNEKQHVFKFLKVHRTLVNLARSSSCSNTLIRVQGRFTS